MQHAITTQRLFRGTAVRIVLVFGKSPDVTSIGLPIWAVFLAWAAFAAPLLGAIAYLRGQESPGRLVERLAQAQHETRAELEKEHALALAGLAPPLADLHFQILQLDVQRSRLATLVGMQQSGPEPLSPESSAVVSLREVGVAELRREVEFITRQLELKFDAMSMIEWYLVEQRLRQRARPDYVLPVPSGMRIVSGFGLRPDPFTGQRRMHQGIDFEAPQGTPVVSVADGLVTQVSALPDYGNLIEITHRSGRTTRYAHLQTVSVKARQVVKRGELIGQVGSTGRSTGPHLHFESLELGVQQNPLSFFLRPAPEAAGR